jgi:magnesium chelatase family protein
VGLPDMAVKESEAHQSGNQKNCGLDYPFQNITVNLAPADIKKEGSGLICRWRSAFSERTELS